MAVRALTGTGTFGTAALWDQGTNTATIHASTDIAVNAAGVLSLQYTAPNVINAATGTLLYLTNKGAATQLIATLQEAGVDTAHTITINLADVNLGWIYLRPPAGYTFTATTPNRYRWKLATDSNTCTVAANSAGTAFSYIATDNRNVVPVAGDPTYVIGANGATVTTVTIDGTRACGADNAAGSPPGSARAVNNGVVVGNGGIIQGDQANTTSLTVTGSLQVGAGGEFRDGTTASPLSASYTHTYTFTAASAGTAGFIVYDGGKATVQGTPKTSTSLWKTVLVSGVGTVADPVITADAVDWNIGDEILVGASSDSATNYNETEPRFIIGKNSANSFVLSSTSGGAETALTYSHTDAVITNVGENIIFKGASTAVTAHFHFNPQTNPGNVDIDWVRFQNIGGTLFFGVAPLSFLLIGTNVNFDYCAVYNHLAVGCLIGSQSGTTTDVRAHTGIVVYSTLTQGGSNTYGSVYFASTSNKTLTECYVMSSPYQGFLASTAGSNTLVRCKAIATNTSNSANQGGYVLTNSGALSFIESEAHASRGAGIVANTSSGTTFTECLMGTKGKNQVADIYTVSSTLNDLLFTSCSFGSDDLIENYQSQSAGSEIAFDRLNDTDNNHRWYTIYGWAESEQTVIRSPGLAVNMHPQDATHGFEWEFQVPSDMNSMARFAGWFLKNPALGTDDVTISLYLPNNPVEAGLPDVSETLGDITGTSWSDATEQAFDRSRPYNGDIPGASTVVINVKSTTPGASLFADDFFNSGNRVVTIDPITGLNLWYKGKPLSVISPSVASAADNAAAVWAAEASANNTPGTMGWVVQKIYGIVKKIKNEVL